MIFIKNIIFKLLKPRIISLSKEIAQLESAISFFVENKSNLLAAGVCMKRKENLLKKLKSIEKFLIDEETREDIYKP